MKQTRKMWVSAAVVGVVVAGGLYVAAAASAGRLEKVSQETRAVVNKMPEPASGPAEAPEPAGTPTPEPSDIVVSHEVNENPGDVLQFWSSERMEGAEPMPMPTVVQRPSGD
ncbi:hypothetical protein [Nonomuraea sp. NPDC050310]|uniref:hypothetical protein n=1 Tax=unclassified Nonomuraea TaxID=2593643 RepID=UPI0033D15906